MNAALPPPPPPIPILHFVACSIEIAILSRFVMLHDSAGVALWLLYLWWSATWSLVARVIRGD